jgi:hypothetical protein
MQIKKKTLTATLAGAIMLASAAAAFAAPATSTANVNVRSGPGGSYGVVDTLRRGDRVEVTGCRGGWCYIEKRGPDGWVSASYLSQGRSGGGRPSAGPGINFEFNFGTPPQPQRPQPPRPPRPDNGGWNGNNGGDWNGPGRDRDRDGPRGPRDWN